MTAYSNNWATNSITDSRITETYTEEFEVNRRIITVHIYPQNSSRPSPVSIDRSLPISRSSSFAHSSDSSSTASSSFSRPPNRLDMYGIQFRR